MFWEYPIIKPGFLSKNLCCLRVPELFQRLLDGRDSFIPFVCRLTAVSEEYVGSSVDTCI